MMLVSQKKIDDYTAAGWWGTTTMWDLFAKHRREQPDAEAVADAPNRAEFAHGTQQRLTWAQLGDQVDRFCLMLLGSGIVRDDIVVVMLPNCVEQFVVYLACARLGIVVTPVPVQYREHELGHILDTTRATAVVTFARIGKADAGHAAAQMFEALKAAHPSLKTVLAWGEGVSEPTIDIAAHSRAAMNDASREALRSAEARAQVTANDVFSICWTSGTEATPKGVPRSHNEWLIVAPSIIESAGIEDKARLLNPFPLINMAGISTALAS